jgi:hypothetical protein
MSGAALTKLGVVCNRIHKQQFYEIQQILNPILTNAGLNVIFKHGWTMGSAGSWDPSHPYYNPNTVKTDAGDVDIMIDADELMVAFPPNLGSNANEKTMIKSSKEQLSNWLTNNGIINTGANLNLSIELPGYTVQVDLIVKKDASTVIAGHQLDYSIDIGMKGSDLWSTIWPDLIRMTPNSLTGKVSLGQDPKTGKNISALQLSPDLGVVDRETGKVLIPWSQKDNIAQLMVGPGITGRDISSVSRLHAALKRIAPDKLRAVSQQFNLMSTKNDIT